MNKSNPLTVRSALLITLRQHGECYISELHGEHLPGMGCDFALSAVCTALEKLDKEALISRDDVRGESSGKPRAYYKLTSKGARESTELVNRLSQICRKAS